MEGFNVRIEVIKVKAKSGTGSNLPSGEDDSQIKVSIIDRTRLSSNKAPSSIPHKIHLCLICARDTKGGPKKDEVRCSQC